MKKKILIAVACVAGVLIIGSVIYNIFAANNRQANVAPVCYKPVIYLYPETETKVDVKLAFNGELTCTYPAYDEGWTVTAEPDGTLIDETGKEYNYLFWEGDSKVDYTIEEGFCVKGEGTESFLEEALAALGLSRREADEFIVFWLPQMQDNAYNVISFAEEQYTDNAALDITPAPDTMIRVFMVWKASDTAVEIEEQTLTAPERIGFTVVEWGGSRVE